MREKLAISEDLLRASIQEQYNLPVTTLEFLPLGLDVNAGIYRVGSEQGTSYLLKVKSGQIYEPGCSVPRYLRDQGNVGVVAPLPTKTGALWIPVQEWTAILYPFIAGESDWEPGPTDVQWRAAGETFRQIHQTALPREGFAFLRKETFDPTEYRRRINVIEQQHINERGGSPSVQALRAYWQASQSTIHTAMAMLESLAGVLQTHAGPLVICHADFHLRNMIRSDNQVFVIDWDDVMLAPKERDFLFVGDPPEKDETIDDPAPFFQGYGKAEIDWIALTYYRGERVVQDVNECARIVFLRDDVEEATKQGQADLFRDCLAPGGEIDLARAAIAHLPANLRAFPL